VIPWCPFWSPFTTRGSIRGCVFYTTPSQRKYIGADVRPQMSHHSHLIRVYSHPKGPVWCTTGAAHGRVVPLGADVRPQMSYYSHLIRVYSHPKEPFWCTTDVAHGRVVPLGADVRPRMSYYSHLIRVFSHPKGPLWCTTGAAHGRVLPLGADVRPRLRRLQHTPPLAHGRLRRRVWHSLEGESALWSSNLFVRVTETVMQ
jgi:hypothetical protein